MVNLTKSIFKILSLHVIKFAYWNFTHELLLLFSYSALVWCLYLMRGRGKHYLFPLIINLTEKNIISSLKCFANRPTETMKSFVLRCIEEVSTWTPFCISLLKYSLPKQVHLVRSDHKCFSLSNLEFILLHFFAIETHFIKTFLSKCIIAKTTFVLTLAKFNSVLFLMDSFEQEPKTVHTTKRLPCRFSTVRDRVLPFCWYNVLRAVCSI